MIKFVCLGSVLLAAGGLGGCSNQYNRCHYTVAALYKSASGETGRRDQSLLSAVAAKRYIAALPEDGLTELYISQESVNCEP